MTSNPALDALRHHVTGAVERGEAEPIVELAPVRLVGVRDEYAPRFGRQQLTLWSGGFSSDFEGFAAELPDHNGYMLRLDYVPGHPKIRVECPSPRTDANYEQVDAALRAAFETAVRKASS